MAAWGSAGGRDVRLRFWDWLLASLAVWLGALVLGAAMVALGMALSALMGLGAPEDDRAHPLMLLFVTGYIFLFSPVFSWLGILLALPAVWLLLRWGAGGWASFALLGAGAGTLAGLLIPGFLTLMASLFGLLAALAFRWVLARRRPEIFHAAPPPELTSPR